MRIIADLAGVCVPSEALAGGFSETTYFSWLKQTLTTGPAGPACALLEYLTLEYLTGHVFQ